MEAEALGLLVAAGQLTVLVLQLLGLLATLCLGLTVCLCLAMWRS